MRRAGDRLLFSWRANIFSRERPRLQAEAPRNLAPHPQEPTHKHLHGTRGSSASFLSVSFLTVRARRLCCEHLLPQIALLVVNMGVGHYFVVVLLFIANGAAGEPLAGPGARSCSKCEKADSGKPSLTLVMQKAHLSGKARQGDSTGSWLRQRFGAHPRFIGPFFTIGSTFSALA